MIREWNLRLPYYEEVINANLIVERFENSVEALGDAINYQVGDNLHIFEYSQFTDALTGRDSWYLITDVQILLGSNRRIIKFEPAPAP